MTTTQALVSAVKVNFKSAVKPKCPQFSLKNLNQYETTQYDTVQMFDSKHFAFCSPRTHEKIKLENNSFFPSHYNLFQKACFPTIEKMLKRKRKEST